VSKFTVFLISMLISFGVAARTVDLTPENSVLIRGEISDESVEQAMSSLRSAVTKRGPLDYTIYLVLDSPGGSIDAGNAFIEYAKSINNLKTVTFFAASMASAIVQALPGERLIIETGTLMFHRARGGFQGQFETGEVESRLDWAKQTVRLLERINADRMKMSIPKYKALVVNELWLFGSMAVKRNGADEVVTVTCSDVLANTVVTTVMNSFFGPIRLNTSACPLSKMATPASETDASHLEMHNEIIKRGVQNGQIKN
jgi:ATP-dependent protease ClpP protease subunit